MDDFDTATYSIESEPDRKQISLDDVILPTVRRSAIQIVSLSPRRQAKRTGPLTTAGADNSTMQVTKLVLKTPPGSPKRQPKPPGVIIKSIQTLAGPGLTGSSSVLTEKRNLPATAASDETVASTITKSAAVVEDAKKKEKSYDPAKAREFMREQQAKRRMEKKENPVGVSGSSKGGTAEKDLIKQRLETLRQSSQKLVSKNLQKARKRSLSCAPKEVGNLNKRPPTGKDKDPASVPCNDRRSSIRPTMGLRKFASTPSLRLIKKDKDPQDSKPAVVLKPKDPSPDIPPKPLSAGSRGSDLRLGKESSSGRSTNPSTASTISKSSIKIGILRKPDHLTLEDIVPQSPLKVSQAISMPTKPKVNAQLIEINAEDDSSEPKTAAEKELKLQVPAVMLVPTNACALPVKQLKQPEGSVTSSKVEEIPAREVPQSQPVKSIPSWLKQSLRQPDPYPFILAVRKKLEAVQSVRDERDKPTACKELEQKQVEQKMPSTRYSSYMNEIESVPFIRKGFATAGQRTEESALNKRPFGNVQEEASSIVTKISPCSSPNTTSDISSIKSDLALPLPPLRSSTKIEIPAGPHDSAATSGPISPLSVERISQMKIATPGNTTARSPHHDRKVLEKTRASSPSRPHAAVHNTSNISHLDRSQKELEYQRLLESFNRSLTHVIEVNQQLYSALKNVPTTAAMPLFPQDVLRLRDEMTQTSLPMPRASTATGSETVDSDQQGGKASDAITTTASNYSDDFEHQSQTEAPPPPTTPHETVASPSTTASSSATSSSSSSANSSARSDTGESTTKSSSQSSSTSSSFDRNEPVVASPREHVPSRPETNATDDERKATSNTTTAHSSDFDSRSFSLSDSHNNTTNNHPPMPEEYLPSFEESLRRKRYPSDREQRQEMNENHEEQKRANKQISRESSIDEEIQPSPDEERSYSFKHSENANDSKVNSFLPLVTSSSEDSVTKSNQRTQQPNKDSLLYVENPDATINSELLTAMFNRTDLEEQVQEELPNGEGDDLGTISSDTSISIAQSLEEASEGSSHGSTPTTVTPTIVAESIESKEQHPPADEGEDGGVESVSPKQNSSNVPSEVASDNSYEEDIFHTKSSSVSGSAQVTTSELAKRLATLHDELEELSETFERTPLMKSPVTAAASVASKSDHFEDQNSSEETITFDYEDDRAESPSPSGDPSKDDDDKASIDATVSQNAAKIEVKLRSKVLSSSGDTVAIVAGSGSVYGRDYPAPLQQLYHHHQTEPPVSSSSSPNIGVRMPDIINEAEVLRRQQLQIEQEIKELEQQVGFFREIPNKPPPPYIPPANGSPLALLFPSEPRIDELIDGRVEELHRDRIAPENLRSDHVTNVYEKLILDMCKELYRDLRPAEPTVSFRTIPHDKRPLVFHNPPDALRCMKDYLRGKIRRVLNDAQLALQQQQHQHQQHQLLLHHQLQQQQQQQTHPSHPQLHHHHLLHHGHCTATMPFLYGNGCASKRKPDQVDEILKQETHDDDARWTNFDREEIEVKDRITDELLKSLLAEALQDMVEACERKEGKEAGLVQRQESAM
uniref:Uncharacterized protein n=1 Tax=Anopheles stephensi TaxID=30069 RepID=A0A182YMV7_ANOST